MRKFRNSGRAAHGVPLKSSPGHGRGPCRPTAPMPRCPRPFVAGLSHHIIQRGNNRSSMFRTPHDYRVFKELLHEAASGCDVGIHGYVFMTTHIHLLATPSTSSSLPAMMKSVGEKYVKRFNRQYERSGTLWEGRYRGSLVSDDRYWVTCLRYIELNPVRAGLVPSPDLYAWSSYRAHAFGQGDPLLTAHPLLLALGQNSINRQAAWRATCAMGLDDDSLLTIRSAINGCRPLAAGPTTSDVDQPASEPL